MANQETQKFSVMVTEEMFEKIEDFRFENRYQTRKEAIIDIIAIGLDAIENGKTKTNDSKKKGDT